jgi:hypothetical protein
MHKIHFPLFIHIAILIWVSCYLYSPERILRRADIGNSNVSDAGIATRVVNTIVENKTDTCCTYIHKSIRNLKLGVVQITAENHCDTCTEISLLEILFHV